MDARAALSHFPVTVRTIEKRFSGRIHDTSIVEAEEGKYVLQKIHEKYIPALPDIDAVTQYLKEKGVETSLLVKSKTGDLSVRDEEYAWRLMTYVQGRTIETCSSPEEAAALGAFLGVFQTVLAEYNAPFAHELPRFRDVHSDIALLEEAYLHAPEDEVHRTIDVLGRIRNFAASISDGVYTLPKRVSHRDPKVNNFRFAAEGAIVCALIDLDTIGRCTVPIEVGDLVRSVMSGQGSVIPAWWEATVGAYRKEARFLTESEWKLIPDGFMAVTLSLAARYLRDAFEKTHFAHDPSYPNRFEQNVARAQKYLALLDSFAAKETEIRRVHQ